MVIYYNYGLCGMDKKLRALTGATVPTRAPACRGAVPPPVCMSALIGSTCAPCAHALLRTHSHIELAQLYYTRSRTACDCQCHPIGTYFLGLSQKIPLAMVYFGIVMNYPPRPAHRRGRQYR